MKRCPVICLSVCIIMTLLAFACDDADESTGTCESLCRKATECLPACVTGSCEQYCRDHVTVGGLECAELSSCSTFNNCLCGSVQNDVIENDAATDNGVASDAPDAGGDDTVDTDSAQNPDDGTTSDATDATQEDSVQQAPPVSMNWGACNSGIGSGEDCSVNPTDVNTMLDLCYTEDLPSRCYAMCGLTYAWDCSKMSQCGIDCQSASAPPCSGTITVDVTTMFEWTQGTLTFTYVLQGPDNGQKEVASMEIQHPSTPVTNPFFRLEFWSCTGQGYICAGNETDSMPGYSGSEFFGCSSVIDIQQTNIEFVTINKQI